jgi:hypothetical protein
VGRITVRPNKELKLTKRGKLRSFAAQLCVGPTNGGRVRWIALGATSLMALGCSIEAPLPSPRATPLPAVFQPACTELPPPPQDLPVSGVDLRKCVPQHYVTTALPLELTVVQDHVVSFRFYSQCSGYVYKVEPRVRSCIEQAVKTWRFDYVRPQCPGTTRDEQTVQLYVMPREQSVLGGEMARADVGVGCAAG